MKSDAEKKTCPRCGEAFLCSASGRCWCYAYDLPADVLDKIESTYNGCLCEKCLIIMAESPKETSTGNL
jgi:hypothetical protein